MKKKPIHVLYVYAMLNNYWRLLANALTCLFFQYPQYLTFKTVYRIQKVQYFFVSPFSSLSIKGRERMKRSIVWLYYLSLVR